MYLADTDRFWREAILPKRSVSHGGGQHFLSAGNVPSSTSLVVCVWDALVRGGMKWIAQLWLRRLNLVPVTIRWSSQTYRSYSDTEDGMGDGVFVSRPRGCDSHTYSDSVLSQWMPQLRHKDVMGVQFSCVCCCICSTLGDGPVTSFVPCVLRETLKQLDCSGSMAQSGESFLGCSTFDKTCWLILIVAVRCSFFE